MRVRKRVLQAFEVQAWTVDAKRSSAFVFVVEDCSRKKVEELSNVSVSDVVPKFVGVLIPGGCPKVFKVTSWERRNGVLAVPLDEC